MKQRKEILRYSRAGVADYRDALSVIDLTETAMGGRMLHHTLGQPLLDLAKLVKRQDAIEWFVSEHRRPRRCYLHAGLRSDMERLINRVRSNIATPRDVVALKHSLEAVPKLKKIIADDTRVKWLGDNLKPQDTAVNLDCLVNRRPAAG